MTNLELHNMADFFLRVISKDPLFLSPKPVNDSKLLYPPFFSKLMTCFSSYSKVYPSTQVLITESYRSSQLQEHYYNNGASRIKTNGMHHYGLAADVIFNIGGIRTYKGNIELLRKNFELHGLYLLGMWDAFHVQYIPIIQQQELRETVASLLKQTL